MNIIQSEHDFLKIHCLQKKLMATACHLIHMNLLEFS